MLTMRRLFPMRGRSFPLGVFQRNISTAKNIAADRDFKEVEIPVPWGKIAGKHWGPLDVEPIIALHGWGDNAGSFDPLIKELPKDMSILAVDFPGHGHSSWLPRGTIYAFIVYAQIINRIKQHYEMERVGLMGHSMGSTLSFGYTAIFPQNVKFVVSLEQSDFPRYSGENYISKFVKTCEKFMEIEESKASAPRFSEQDAIKRFIIGRGNSLDEEMCRTLFVRGATKHQDGTVSFNSDPRIQLVMFDIELSEERLKNMAGRIQCPYAFIEAETRHFSGQKQFHSDMLKVMKTRSSDFRLHTMPGNHHFHMTNTRNLAELISPFIKKYR